MAAMGKGYGICLLHFLSLCIYIRARDAMVKDLGVLQSNVNKLDDEFKDYLQKASCINEMKLAYQSNMSLVNTPAVNGKELVENMAKQLGQVLGNKLKALKASVAFAEKLSETYKWNADLKLGDVTYIDTKKVNLTVHDQFHYKKKFKQKVSFLNSSVHIPVEIYEGDREILNGLSWTANLDSIWRQNMEEDSGLMWQFFGSQRGFMRSYPGSLWRHEGVDLFDVRRRPWYTQGASSPKDMLILMDTSGSTHGQALALMKQAAMSLLETLGENDFVNVAAFSAKVNWAGCLQTFVQANHRHKKVMGDYIKSLEAKGMANYSAGLEFAFQEFEKFNRTAENSTDGEGANCNRIIMFLTDGGTEKPEVLLKKHNWDKGDPVRIFTYAVGPTANPIAAVKWIACANRGYFERIPAMGAIRSKVQGYYRALGNIMAKNNVHDHQVTTVYEDVWGLGMMTTVTLPVYNKTENPTKHSNQTILGVMGVDVTVRDLEAYIPKKQLGPNGYAFAINSNGYIIFHPYLKAQKGWLKDPPNVDLLDVEYETEEKVKLRKDMIDGMKGNIQITTFVLLPDDKHADNKTRVYYYASIPNSTFSLAIVLDPDDKKYVKSTKADISLDNGIKYLSASSKSTVLYSLEMEYCPNITRQVSDNASLSELLDPTGPNVEDLITALNTFYDANQCNKEAVQHLFWDAKVTSYMDDFWEKTKDLYEGVESMFVATDGGLTRVYPVNDSVYFEHMRNPWERSYYKRTYDSDKWIYTPSFLKATVANTTEPVILATKRVNLEGYTPAVIGLRLRQTKLREMLTNKVEQCKDTANISCYLLDDGAFIVLTSDPDEEDKVGMFLGDVDNVAMDQLYNKSVYFRKEEYDFQASCPKTKATQNAGIKSVFIPNFFELLNLKWWTTKLTWFYLNFNIYQWLYSRPTDYAMAANTQGGEGNRSCIKHSAQYYFKGDSAKNKLTLECGNCTREVATAVFNTANLLLLMVQKECGGDCEVTKLLQAPTETSDPDFDVHKCAYKKRYRKRPEGCYDHSPHEDTNQCGHSSPLRASWTLLFMQCVVIAILLKAGLTTTSATFS